MNKTMGIPLLANRYSHEDGRHKGLGTPPNTIKRDLRGHKDTESQQKIPKDSSTQI